MMRILVAVLTAVALLTAPAMAQMGGKRNQGGNEGPKTPAGPKIDEKAYKAALDRIPEPKQKYDPWGGVAPAQAPAAKKDK
jgi:hypothetical protein